MQTLEALKTLAYNGEPLEITLRAHGKNRQRPRGYTTIARPNGPRVPFMEGDADLSRRALEYALQHYPAEASVNGIPVKRNPFPDLATLRTTTYNDRQADSWTQRNLNLEPQAERLDRPVQFLKNCLAAGVFWYIQGTPSVSLQHYSKVPSTSKNHQPLMLMEFSPTHVLTPKEVQQLSQPALDSLPSIPANSPILRAVTERAHTQIANTLAHPKRPDIYRGPVHRYVIQAAGNICFAEGAPIAVSGVPVSVNNLDLDNPEAMTLVEALYDADSTFVPADNGPGSGQDSPKPIDLEDALFEITKQDPPPGEEPWSMGYAKEIRITFHTHASPEPHTVLANVYTGGENQYDKQTLVVPGTTSAEDLANRMTRAYYVEKAFTANDYDDLKDERQQIDHDCATLARALLEDRTEAFRKTLQDLANSYHTDIPRPNIPVTVTSRDGSITITANPA